VASIGGDALLEQFYLWQCKTDKTLFLAAPRHKEILYGSKLRSRKRGCATKLGKARGLIDAASADAIIQEIERYVFDPKHASAL